MKVQVVLKCFRFLKVLDKSLNGWLNNIKGYFINPSAVLIKNAENKNMSTMGIITIQSNGNGKAVTLTFPILVAFIKLSIQLS